MKKIILTSLAAMCITAAAHADSNIKLIVDDKIIDTSPVSVNDRTLVPLRALMESTGAEVLWDDAAMGIDITKNNEKVHLAINNSVMNTPGGDIQLDAPPILYNDTTTYVPLRAVCEAFDFAVDWDEGTETILINAPDGCPFVDLYNGLTVGDYMESSGQTEDEFNKEYGIDFSEFKDAPLILFSNALPISYMAQDYSMSTDDLKSVLGIALDIPDDTAWGDALGEAPLRNFISLSSGVEYSDEIFDLFREYYGLGEEYSPDTKYKYVRTIIDTIDLNNYMNQSDTAGTAQLPSSEEQAVYDALLPSLCENKQYFTITLEDGSQMSGELYPDLAKNTVENFVKLCNEGFYNGLIFHRVIDGFMIQGGGFDKDLNPKASNSVIGEFYANGYINPLKHERGVISMARAEDPNSASSQFFIMDEAAPYLDGYYAAFGRITEGFDVLDKIAQAATGSNELGMSDVPVSDIVIKSIAVN